MTPRCGYLDSICTAYLKVPAGGGVFWLHLEPGLIIRLVTHEILSHNPRTLGQACQVSEATHQVWCYQFKCGQSGFPGHWHLFQTQSHHSRTCISSLLATTTMPVDQTMHTSGITGAGVEAHHSNSEECFKVTGEEAFSSCLPYADVSSNYIIP